MNEKMKKIFGGIILVIALSIILLFVYNKVANADTDADKIAIDYASIVGIDTGSGNFDSSDGLTYENDGYTIKSYTPGNDSSKDNRLVRSFDSLTYHFEFGIKGKQIGTDYEDRKVDIKVTLNDELAKYVTFDKNAAPGEKTHTFTFNSIDTYGKFDGDIVLYVLGAPNNIKINPKFEIQESTNTDSNYLVNLGSTSFDNDKYNYEYDSNNTDKYSTVSTNVSFKNYMPTIVSSKAGNVKFNLLPQTNEGQSATYNDAVGRYLTYVLAVSISGDSTKGIKGLTMPSGDITFDLNTSQNGTIKTVSLDESWARLYGQSVSPIENVVVSFPYSSNSDSNKTIKAPGTLKLTKKSDNLYSGNINGYSPTFTSATVAADGSSVGNSNHYIGTYAISIFSNRDSHDAKNDIVTSMNINNIKVKDITGSNIAVDNVGSSLVNKYYEVVDYTLTGEFYDVADRKISDVNSRGSVSKGTTVTYKTTFNYSKTLSNQGLKEVIKIDPDAFRVMKIADKDIKINVESDSKLSENDFEVKFVSGDYSNKNYVASNYDSNSLNNRLTKEDVDTVKSSCALVNKSLNSYSKDQIMNLYGGPCISPGSNVETVFNKIDDAKKDNTEVPITKVIVQTKKGVVLPDSVKVTVEVRLRVRNVPDLTKTYQVTSVATSSDYDNELVYYSPRITNDENGITSPNNYRKTIYNGSKVTSIDNDSPWGDSLKIVNFQSSQEITVTNKNSDGTVKNSYNVNNNEIINFKIKTTITDNNEVVGADDTWYINKLKVYVIIPNGLNYIPNKDLGTPEVYVNSERTMLVYTLPYTKPNMTIKDIEFNASLSPNIKGSANEMTVTSTVQAINVNNEVDNSYFGNLTGSFTIYATGIDNVIVLQKIGDKGPKVEKNSEFSYLFSLYNNTDNDINDYNIVNILPSNNDKNGSSFNGSYEVKVNLPDSLSKAKVYCSTLEYNKLSNEIFNKYNDFKECNAASEYVNATAIKIEGINIKASSFAEDISLYLKPNKNNYNDKYVNSFIGGSKSYNKIESNKTQISVINRNISGRVFSDNNHNGIEESTDTYLANIPVTLYKLDSENNMSEISSSVTSQDGKYKFDNLDVGKYKVRVNYNDNEYDLTLRYASNDTTKDSDAYKISDGIAEISNKKTPSESDGIKLTKEIESASDMNVGLLPRKTLGFSIKKYITKIDLSYNNILNTFNYNNESKVALSVKNSLSATAKVYYGIEISNTSNQPGYVKLIDENIPSGLIFDPNNSYNEGWFYSNGELQNISLENDLINPGESRYLKIVLDMPSQNEARTFINTVTLLDIESKEEESQINESEYNPNKYKIGEEVIYAGVDWHVVNVDDSEDGEQILTLLADSGTVKDKMSHTSSNDAIYKWSNSLINRYINTDFASKVSLNLPILHDNIVCDDASGIPNGSHGGTLSSEGLCTSNIYNSYKVRLLTETEFNTVKNSSEDLSWLYGSGDFWLMNSVYVDQKFDVYGNITQITNVKNLAKYVSKTNTSVQTGYNSKSTGEWIRSTSKKEVRPVITVSNRNIIGN